MAHMDPLPRESLPQFEDVFTAMEQQAGFIPNAYLTMARRPELLDALQQFLRQAFAGTVPRETKSLVALMSSYGAGCRYCQAHQGTFLAHMGIDPAKLADLADFERSDRFTPAERAAMRLALASGQSPNAVTRAHFDDLRQYFDDGEIVEIVGVLSAFGFLNRWHETMATDLEEEPLAVASQVLGGLAWEPGRHAGA